MRGGRMLKRSSGVLSRLEVATADGCTLFAKMVDLVEGARGRPLLFINGVGQRGGTHFNLFEVTGRLTRRRFQCEHRVWPVVEPADESNRLTRT